MKIHAWTLRLLVPCSALGLIYCGNKPDDARYAVTQFITGLTAVDGTRAIQQQGTPPTSSGGPSVTPSANASVINGGSNVARLQAAQVFQTIYTSIGSVAGGVNDFYELRLPVSTTSTTLTYTLSRDIPSDFDAVFQVASPSGAVGPPATVRQTKLAASTGEVQVSVSWDADSDVDLHVVDPRGEEIFYGSPTSASGGQLDLDSNAACSLDRKNNENIRWTSNAPAGTYTVRLDYWSSCGVARTEYAVTVNNGGSSTLFTGNFTGPGDGGGRGSGRPITTFTRGSGLSINELSLIRPPSLMTPSGT